MSWEDEWDDEGDNLSGFAVPIINEANDNESKWDDEEEDVAPEIVVPKSAPKNEDKKKVVKPKKKKARVATPVVIERKLAPEVEKKRLLKLEQDADFQNTVDMFGEFAATNDDGDDNNENNDVGGDMFGAIEVPKGNNNSLMSLKLETPEDFEFFALELEQKLDPVDTHNYYVEFVKSLLRKLTKNLTTEEVQAVNSALKVIENSKIKIEKEKRGVTKKKKGPKIKLTKSEIEEDMIEDEFAAFM